MAVAGPRADPDGRRVAPARGSQHNQPESEVPQQLDPRGARKPRSCSLHLPRVAGRKEALGPRPPSRQTSRRAWDVREPPGARRSAPTNAVLVPAAGRAPGLTDPPHMVVCLTGAYLSDGMVDDAMGRASSGAQTLAPGPRRSGRVARCDATPRMRTVYSIDGSAGAGRRLEGPTSGGDTARSRVSPPRRVESPGTATAAAELAPLAPDATPSATMASTMRASLAGTQLAAPKAARVVSRLQRARRYHAFRGTG